MPWPRWEMATRNHRAQERGAAGGSGCPAPGAAPEPGHGDFGAAIWRYSVLRATVRAVVLSVDGGVRHAAPARLRLQRHTRRLLITAWLDGHAVLDVHHGMRHETAHRVVSDQVPEPGAR